MQGRLILVIAACAVVYACGGPAFAQTVAQASPAPRLVAVKAPASARPQQPAASDEPNAVQRLALARCELDDEQDASLFSPTARSRAASNRSDCALRR